MSMDHDYCYRDTNVQCMDYHYHDYLPNANQGRLILKGNSVAQRMLKNTVSFFNRKFPDLNSTEAAAECLGVSISTVRLYVDGPTEESTRAVTRKRSRPLSKDIADNTLTEIRNVVYNMYIERTQCNYVKNL